MTSDRIKFICALIGIPYSANAKGPEAYDCWHLVREVRAKVFQDELPEYDVPEEPSLLWLAKMFERDGERAKWKEVPVASDGNLVLMSCASMSVHIGIFLREGGILHTTKESGVVLQEIPVLKATGWGNLRYFERACAV